MNKVLMILLGILLGITAALAVYLPLMYQLTGSIVSCDKWLITIICIGALFGTRWGIFNLNNPPSSLLNTLPFSIAIIGWAVLLTTAPGLSTTALVATFIGLMVLPVILKKLIDKE